MPQAVQIETQAEQQGLAHLHGQAAAWGPRRKLAFDRREDTLDQSTTPIESLRERLPHFGAHAVHAPSFLPTLGGNHTLRSKFLSNVGVIPLAVELRIGQHQPNAGLLRGGFDDRRQIGAIVPRATSCRLRQQKLLIQVRHDHPLQPMPPGQRFLSVVMQTTHEKCADRSLRQTRRVHAHTGSPSSFPASPAQTTHRLADRLVDSLIVQPLQETVQGREIGHAGESQRLTQFAMFAEPHLGFAKGPVLVAHPTENRQQLGLRELALAETAAVARKHRFGNLQSDAGERQESDFGQGTSCLDSKQQFPRTWGCEFSWL